MTSSPAETITAPTPHPPTAQSPPTPPIPPPHPAPCLPPGTTTLVANIAPRAVAGGRLGTRGGGPPHRPRRFGGVWVRPRGRGPGRPRGRGCPTAAPGWGRPRGAPPPPASTDAARGARTRSP